MFDRTRRIFLRIAAVFVVAVFIAGTPVKAQKSTDGKSLSKLMRNAVQSYEKGDDLGAMDKFMQVLVSGNPIERPLANRYLNLISERMALGGKFKDQAPIVGVTETEDVPDVDVEEPTEVEEVDPLKEEGPRVILRKTRPKAVSRSQGRMTKSDRELMKKEIEGKIRNRSRVLLGQIRKYQDARVVMANSRLPRGIGIPVDLLFADGTQYKRDAGKILDSLNHLIYALGATQVIILPENAVLGDAKIMDLRRTMAVSSHFIKEGIAPSRIRVNLLSNQVDIPRGLSDFRGILLLFVFNQPLDLTADSAIGAEAGPPISLGVSPDYLDANKDEGAIIEFSVMEPQAGLLSWKFQLRGPGKKAGDDMVTVQEVKGAGPVFHQIYWNGRNKYFGDILPGGRYECVLTATDSKNKSRKRHLWINVKGKPVEKAVTQTIAKAEPPPATLEPDPAPVQRKVRGKTIESEKAAKARRARRRKERRMRRRAAQKESSVKKGKTLISTPKEESSANAEDAASRPARAGAVNYQVVFVKNAAGITPDGENILNRVADTMHYYPLDNINLVGYAYSGEQDSDSLASRRADAVSRHLVQKHGMKRDRIQVQTKIMDSESHKVEIYIVSGGS